MNSPWVVGIVGGLVVALIVGIVGYSLTSKRKKHADAIIQTHLEGADSLRRNGMLGEALDKYKDLLEKVSIEGKPKLYARIRNNQGIAFKKLSEIRDTENNIKRAIHAYEEALKIYRGEEYLYEYSAKII